MSQDSPDNAKRTPGPEGSVPASAVIGHPGSDVPKKELSQAEFFDTLRQMAEKRDRVEPAPEEIAQMLDETHDRAWLGYWRLGSATVGFVDEVNGPGAVPQPEYVPSRHELLTLARYWAKELTDVEIFMFFAAQAGSSDCRLQAYAARRLNRLASVLGEDAIRPVISQVEDEYRTRIGNKNWEIFLNADEEERDKLLEEEIGGGNPERARRRRYSSV